MPEETKTPSAEKIIVQYDDGSTKELTKAVAFHFEPVPGNDNQICVTADMVQVTGKDLAMIVEGVVEMAYRLGLFGGSDAGQEDEDD